MSRPMLPVPEFCPTPSEFADFMAFVHRIERLCPAGAAIVRPPCGWRPRKNLSYDDVDSMSIQAPIRQQLVGSKGVFVAVHVVQPKRTMKSFREEAQKLRNQCHPPSLEFETHVDDHLSKQKSEASEKRSNQNCTRGLISPQNDQLQDVSDAAYPTQKSQIEFVGPTWTPSSVLESQGAMHSALVFQPCDDPTTSAHLDNDPGIVDSDDVELKMMAHATAIGPAASPGPVPSKDSLAKLDTAFWKNVLFRRPLYGADLPGSLFDDDVCKLWNLKHLGTILDFCPPISGINDPYLYFGMFGSMFCFHVEDADLYGINYLHFGAPKTWYTIPTSHRKRFESLCQQLYPSHFDTCKEFLRHKQGLISLDVLRKHGIPFGRVTQLPGTFTIVFPGVYHAGFNHDFNIAEAINFASLRWLKVAKTVSTCQCRKDTVKLNVEALDRVLFPGKYTTDFARRCEEIANVVEQIRDAKRAKHSHISSLSVSSARSLKNKAKAEMPLGEGGVKVDLLESIQDPAHSAMNDAPESDAITVGDSGDCPNSLVDGTEGSVMVIDNPDRGAEHDIAPKARPARTVTSTACSSEKQADIGGHQAPEAGLLSNPLSNSSFGFDLVCSEDPSDDDLPLAYFGCSQSAQQIYACPAKPHADVCAEYTDPCANNKISEVGEPPGSFTANCCSARVDATCQALVDSPAPGMTNGPATAVVHNMPRRKRLRNPAPPLRMTQVTIRGGLSPSERERALLDHAFMCGVELKMLAVSALLNTTRAVLGNAANAHQVALLCGRISRLRRRYQLVQSAMFEPVMRIAENFDTDPGSDTSDSKPFVREIVTSMIDLLLAAAVDNVVAPKELAETRMPDVSEGSNVALPTPAL